MHTHTACVMEIRKTTSRLSTVSIIALQPYPNPNPKYQSSKIDTEHQPSFSNSLGRKMQRYRFPPYPQNGEDGRTVHRTLNESRERRECETEKNRRITLCIIILPSQATPCDAGHCHIYKPPRPRTRAIPPPLLSCRAMPCHAMPCPHPPETQNARTPESHMRDKLQPTPQYAPKIKQ